MNWEYLSGQLVPRISRCKLKAFVWRMISSWRNSITLNIYIYTISFPNTTSELAFPLMRGDTWNFPRHILYPGKGMQLDEDHLLRHRRLLVIYWMLVHLGKGQNLSILKSCWVQAIVSYCNAFWQRVWVCWASKKTLQVKTKPYQIDTH